MTSTSWWKSLSLDSAGKFKFAEDSIRIEKFISEGSIYDESELAVLFRDYSDLPTEVAGCYCLAV